MTWVLIGVMLAVGFGEYWCAHYFTKKILNITDNKAHLALAGLILLIMLLPKNYIFMAFLIASMFTPLVIWFGIQDLKHK